MPKLQKRLQTMKNLIIIDKEKYLKTYDLTKVVTTIGPAGDNDIIVPELPHPGFSIIDEGEDLRLLPLDPKTKSPALKWNTSQTGPSCYSIGEVTFILLPEIKYPEKDQAADWDFSLLPKNPKDDNFPNKLLEFLLHAVSAHQGALFYYKDNELKTLSSQNLEMKSDGKLFLCNYLNENREKFVRMSFQTHTLLFHAGLEPCDFILTRANCLDKGEVVLYLPEPTIKGKFPEGILKSLLTLTSLSLSLHLVYVYNKNLLSIPTELENGFYWGRNPKMLRLKQLANRLAASDLSILIFGETGAGKEGLAKYLAKKAGSKKMVSVNCASIPANLAESILFGHTKGAFTGANSNHKGMISEANNGILFLDEIAELSLDVQGKLLRVLQDGVVQPLGGKEEKVNIKIIAATHRNLNEMVKNNTFREDLYYRLNEATLILPPLRERPEDIMPLAKLFLDETVKANSLNKINLSPSAEKIIMSHTFPGNVRELRSLFRRAAILCESEVINAPLIESLLFNNEKKSNQTFPLNLNEAKQIFLTGQVNKALKAANNNKTKAAEFLGITPRTLFRIIAELNHDKLVTEDDKNVIGDKDFSIDF